MLSALKMKPALLYPSTVCSKATLAVVESELESVTISAQAEVHAREAEVEEVMSME